jgi:GlpG protein
VAPADLRAAHGVVSNIAQNAYSGPHFGGISGVVYGLFGYVWLFGRFEPSSGLQLSRESTIIMVVWLLLCTTGRIGPVANMCHFVGLGMGLLLAGVEVLFKRARA